VPRLKRERVDLGIAYLMKLTYMLSQLSYSISGLHGPLRSETRSRILSGTGGAAAPLRGICPASIAMFDNDMRYLR